MQISFTLLPPQMPDTISFEGKPGTRQEGFNPHANQIRVGALTEQQATEYAELMKEEFIKHWKNESTSNNTSTKILKP